MVPGKRYAPEDFLRIVRRRKWLIVVPFVVITAGAAIYLQSLKDMYSAETVIMVVPQRIPESFVRTTVTARIEDRLRTMTPQILSRSRLEGIIEDNGLYRYERDLGGMEMAVARMRRDISTLLVGGDTFRVRYVHDDPQMAKRIVERLAALFMDENLRDRVVLAEGTSQFLDGELNEARARLIVHEKKLEAYRKLHAGELPSQLESNLQVLQNMQSRVQSLEEAIGRDRDRRFLLESTLNDLKNPLSPESVVAQRSDSADAGGRPANPAVTRLQEAQATLAELQQRLKDTHPDVIRQRRIVRDLASTAAAEAGASVADDPGLAGLIPEEIARRKRTKEVEADVAQLDKQIASKEAEQLRLRNLMGGYENRVEAVPTRESEMTELMRDYRTLQDHYAGLLQKEQESRIAANLERRQIGEQFKVLDPARVPEKPIWPNRLQMSLIAALVGLGLGFGLVALIEYRDTSLRSEEDVVISLGLPVLAVIPVIRAEDESSKRRRLAIVGATLLIVLGSEFARTWGV